MGAPDAPFAPAGHPPIDTAELFKLESLVIREIADRFDAVIVGRAGFHVLAGHPGTSSPAAVDGARGAGVPRAARDGDLRDGGREGGGGARRRLGQAEGPSPSGASPAGAGTMH